MTLRLRKLALTAHITSSVGWLGAVAGFLALAVAGLTSRHTQMVRAAYLAMELTAWFVIVPLALASLLTGLVSSVGTTWGLLRHYWVLAKLLMTLFAITVLLLKMGPISYIAGVAAETTWSGSGLREARRSLVAHAGGGLLVLLVVTVLGVYKPWGMTRYGRRKQHERREVSLPIPPRRPATTRNRGDTRRADLPLHPDTGFDTGVGPNRGWTTSTLWGLYVLLGIIGLVLLFVVLHLTGDGSGGH